MVLKGPIYRGIGMAMPNIRLIINYCAMTTTSTSTIHNTYLPESAVGLYSPYNSPGIIILHLFFKTFVTVGHAHRHPERIALFGVCAL